MSDEYFEDDAPVKANAIEKAFTILLSFLPANEPISTTDLSRKLGFHKATTSRILRMMADYGFVRQNDMTRQYSLGDSIVRLASAVHESLDAGLVSIAKPYLTELRRKTGQSVTMELLVGHTAIIGCVVEGDIGVSVAGQVGESVGWNATAGIRSLLAYSDSTLVDEMLAMPMVAVTPNTQVSPEAYRASFEEIRQNGYAYENGEVALGIDALGAPVFNHKGKPLLSISIVGLSHEIQGRRAEFSALLKEVARNVSNSFMYNG